MRAATGALLRTLLLALVVALVRPQGLAAQSAPAGTGLPAVEAGLTVLLDRYARPLEPAPLLEAGWRGALQASGVPDAAPPALPAFPAGRSEAWDEFQNRFAALVLAGGDADAMARAANQAMARSLGDCHTRFAPSFERETQSLSGPERYGGIGAASLDGRQFAPPAPGPVFVALVEGGPAQRAGIRLGDAVLAVDGVEAAALPTGRVTEMVRGAPGTTVELRLDRPGVPQPVTVVIEREWIEDRVLESRYVAPDAPGTPGIGYVRLRQFARPAAAALPGVVDELRAQGAAGWVLDLRDNSGGELQTFVGVASLFLNEGPLGVTVNRSGREQAIAPNGALHRPFARPLAVLVNGRSASAAELLAADVQDYGAGRVFGTSTAGCFGTSQLFRLPDGSAQWLTVSALQSGGARRDVHKVGVVPDEVIGRTRDDLAGGRDPQLARAVAWLRAGGR